MCSMKWGRKSKNMGRVERKIHLVGNYSPKSITALNYKIKLPVSLSP